MADKEIDYDSMSDEDFMNAIENASIANVDDAEDFEDTDHTEYEEEEAENESETNDLDDGQDEETENEQDESLEDEGEENAQIDEDSESEDESGADSETEDEAETEDEDEDEDESESEDEADEIDYKKQYEEILAERDRLQGFYNEVTSEFVANGKKMKGFDDPKKIIQAQQMAAGFAEKMSTFKQYRPFMNALKEKGLLDNPDKFNFAMNLLDGDPEAIKQQMKSLDIDPYEMDMENINYTPKNQVASKLELAYDDILENAKSSNVESQVRQVITRDWDDQSVIDLLEDPQSSSDLVEHISSGAYAVVQDRIAEKRRIDVTGAYTSKPMIQQYREAALELENEYMQYLAQNQQAQQSSKQVEQETVVNKQKQEAYKAKVEKRNAKADEARKRATTVSKKKTVTKPAKKIVSVDDMTDEQITQYLDGLIYAQ